LEAEASSVLLLDHSKELTERFSFGSVWSFPAPHMAFSLFGKKNKPVLQRAKDDAITRMRLKYAPYYHTVDKAEGSYVWVEGRKLLMLSSNEYLGLSMHPRVIEASRQATAEWGTSPCGSRLANGSRRYHVELEEALAAFLGKEACQITTAGYLACVTSLSSVVGKGDALIVDQSIHSALWDGAQLSKANIERFTHEDMNSLSLLLQRLDPKQPKLIAVDGVYSMEGHTASLAQICDLADAHDAGLVVDDAHGFGVFGRDGRGICDECGVTDRVDMIVGTFSKSLASTGGFVAGDRSLIEFLRSNSKQIIFCAALGPGPIAAAHEALKVMQEEPEHRLRLWENTRYFHSILRDIGLDFWNSPSPAVPIVLGDKELCFMLWKELWEAGFFTVMSVSPGVPVGKDLIRTAISSLHTKEQLDQLGDALRKAVKKLRISTRV
jgi:8-amino-7-oxononanoate synthase